MEKKTFWLPTIPYDLIHTINRVAAAQGSVAYAMSALDAHYNGHQVTVHFNDYRQYWIAEFYWGGRNVLCRGSFEDCVLAAKREYERGAKGCTVRASFPAEDTDKENFLVSQGFQPWSEAIAAAHHDSFYTPLMGQVGSAFWYEKHVCIPAISFLTKAKDVDEFNTMVQDALNGRACGQA
jgi:hypothetical protein